MLDSQMFRMAPCEFFSVPHSEILFLADGLGRWRWLSPAWTSKTGYDVEGAIGHLCERYVHVDDQALWRRLFQEALGGSELTANSGELRLCAADGRFVWMSVTFRSQQNGSGSGVNGMMVDISKQRATQRENSELLLAINAAMDGIARVTSEGVYTHLNRAHLTMFGYEYESELLGKTWKEIYYESEVSRIESEVFPILMSKGCWSGTAMAKRRDGSTFPEDLSLTMLPGGGIICICRDATERVQALSAWKQSEARWQLAAASIQEGLWDFDVNSGLLHLSPRWMELLGLSPSELTIPSRLLTLRFLPRVHPDDISFLRSSVRDLLGGASDRCDHEIRIRSAAGEYRWLHVRCRALFDPDGVLTRIVGSAADIASRKAQEELAARNFARERELVELKSHFVAMASHELRTPVATLSLSVELLEKHGFKLDEGKIASTLAHMRGAANQLRSIVANLLILGESNEGKLNCNLELLRVADLLGDIVTQASQTDQGRRRIDLICIPPDLEVHLDRQLVRSILLNLVSNACKYSPEQSRVEVRGEEVNGRLRIQVIDQGIGIPKEEQPRLFSHFFRASNASGEEGTGLGLVIAKRCCEAHGASISCDSEVGQGTTFTITFPKIR